MIVQITMVRNELNLIRELLPVWKKYADGFVFLLHNNTDDTLNYLNQIKKEYNVLDVLEVNDKKTFSIETDMRQLLFDTALKYTNKIICLDADEYLDGSITKNQLEELLENNKNTVFYLNWIQYTSTNKIRVDGPWKHNLKDRMGCYEKNVKFEKVQMHSSHLPIPENKKVLDKNSLFIAHLHWLDKNHAAIKQYFWKVEDYYNNWKYGIDVTDVNAYNQSVGDFDWEEEYTDYSLKIRNDLYEDFKNSNNYKIDVIKKKTKEASIPNLGDWGFNIVNSIPMYFCTYGTDDNYLKLINMIGSIHNHNFYDVEKILVYDCGLNDYQRRELHNIKKVEIVKLNNLNREVIQNKKELNYIKSNIIENVSNKYPYILYLNPDSFLTNPLNDLFFYIKEKNYSFFDFDNTTDEGLEKEFYLNTDVELSYGLYKKNVSCIKRNYLVSVITAIGNLEKYEKFIPIYFSNILQQYMFNRIEFIIVYSEWSSLFDEYSNFDNIRFIKETKPINMYYAWNDGIQHSTTEYITNWNIDDIRININNFIKYDFLNNNINADLVYNYHTSVDENDIDNISLENAKTNYIVDEFHKYATSFCMAGPDPMWRKSANTFYGFFDYENYNIIGDWEMWIRLAKNGLYFKLLPYLLCIYVNHKNTVSNSSGIELENQKEKLKIQYNF